MSTSPPVAPSSSRALERTALAVGVALLAALVWPIVYGGVPTMHDMGDWYVPMRSWYADRLARGERFDWLPDVYAGYYLQGDGQVGMYHPLHWLSYRWLPIGLGVTIEMAIGFVAMVCGVTVLLRRFGIERAAALFGGIAIGFSGYHLRHFEHLNAIQVLGHVPWVLIAIDIALRSRDLRRARLAAVAVGVLTTSELLIGYPQYFWFSSFCEAVFALCLMVRLRPDWRRVAWLVGAKLVGVGGGAVQLLPTADLLGTSVRESMSIADRMQWPWYPLEVVNLFAPYATDQRTLAIFYPGFVVVTLVVWLLVRRAAGVYRALVAVCLGVTALAVWLALGEFGGLFRLHLELPVVGVFRMPYRYLCIATLAIGIVAAIAWQQLLRRARGDMAESAGGTWLSRNCLFVLPLLGSLCLLAVILLDASDRSFYVERHTGDYRLAAFGLLGIASAAWLVHRAERGSRRALVALIVLMAVDLGVYGYRFVYRGGLPVTLSEYVAAIPAPPTRDGRVIGAWANQHLFLGLRSTGGYMPLVPDAPFLREIDEFGARSEPHLRVASVHWVQDETGGDAWTQKSFSVDALRAQSRTFLAVRDPLPRARLVSRAQIEADVAGMDVDRVASVEHELSLATDSAPGAARWLGDLPGQLTIEVEAPARQLLVVSERAQPGWRVRVDGREQAVVRTYGTFLGCVVDASSRLVEFEFAPDSLRRGRLVSLASLVLLFALAVLASRRTARS